jgi:hypothetical protein
MGPVTMKSQYEKLIGTTSKIRYIINRLWGTYPTKTLQLHGHNDGLIQIASKATMPGWNSRHTGMQETCDAYTAGEIQTARREKGVGVGVKRHWKNTQRHR